jgi:hypothetical protein
LGKRVASAKRSGLLQRAAVLILPLVEVRYRGILGDVYAIHNNSGFDSCAGCTFCHGWLGTFGYR